jgi:hypothetical protein
MRKYGCAGKLERMKSNSGIQSRKVSWEENL